MIGPFILTRLFFVLTIAPFVIRKVLSHLIFDFPFKLLLLYVVDFGLLSRGLRNLFNFDFSFLFCLFFLKVSNPEFKLRTFLYFFLEMLQCPHIFDVLNHLLYAFSQCFYLNLFITDLLSSSWFFGFL